MRYRFIQIGEKRAKTVLRTKCHFLSAALTISRETHFLPRPIYIRVEMLQFYFPGSLHHVQCLIPGGSNPRILNSRVLPSCDLVIFTDSASVFAKLT